MLSNENSIQEIIGNSHALRSVLDLVRMVAPTPSTVLIQGETGTGKELIARAIHKLSPRSSAPFVIVNCAAIPDTLLESEMFGHERGAFTGAVAQRLGRFEMANGGTIFLDEIGEMPQDLQAKLLRVLQGQEFERLGGGRTVRVDVRVVAATNRDLSQMVDERQFRADLFYRLSVFPVRLPPLRDRREDIPALVSHFVTLHARRMNKIVEEIPEDTMHAMCSYDWPGNVRELQNFIERGVIVSDGPKFRPPLHQLRSRLSENGAHKTLDAATRDHILLTLKETNGVVGGKRGAAARLGLARTTLLSKMRRLGIEAQSAETLAVAAAAFATIA